MKKNLINFDNSMTIQTTVTGLEHAKCFVKAQVTNSFNKTQTAHSSGRLDNIEAIEEKAINRALSLFNTRA